MNALRARWQTLAARERRLIAVAATLVLVALVYGLALQPAWRTLSAAPAEHARLDARLQRMQQAQAQAQTLQAAGRGASPASSTAATSATQPAAALEATVRQRLGAQARVQITAERASVSFNAVSPDTLARWLQEARVNARALPLEARLTRNAAGLWEGNLVLALPAP